MKNVCIIFLTLVILLVAAFGLTGKSEAPKEVGSEYLRIHIRANSNEEEDQAVKCYVRDQVVAYLTPIVAECQSKGESVEKISQSLGEIRRVAGQALREKGFFYGADAQIKIEKFPTRVYGEYVLPAGEYTALILGLGNAVGDNWWCVVYPPLCFTAGNGNVVYKSKILEIIRQFSTK